MPITCTGIPCRVVEAFSRDGSKITISVVLLQLSALQHGGMNAVLNGGSLI